MKVYNRGYDLTIAEDLYNFSSDCEEATLECPQQTAWNPIDFDMGRNTVSPHEVFLYWREKDTLWNSGYSDCLSSEAKQTFSRYIMRETYDEDTEEYLGVEVFDTVTNSTLSKETMNIFKFTTKGEKWQDQQKQTTHGNVHGMEGKENHLRSTML